MSRIEEIRRRYELTKEMDDGPISFLQEDLEQLFGYINAQESQLKCDCCFGTGNPLSGKPCSCDGTGAASSQRDYFRSEMLKQESLLAEAVEMAEFYGDEDSYQMRESYRCGDGCCSEFEKEPEVMEDNGLIAKAFLAKVKEK